MRSTLFFITLLIFLCSYLTAQEKFNTVYYDSDGNISNTVVVTPDGFVTFAGTTVAGGRGVGLTKISNTGSVVFQKDFKFDGLSTYEGRNNSFGYDSLSDTYYYCGTAEDTEYNAYPFIVLADDSLDTLNTFLIDIDSVVGAYGISKYNDTIYTLITQNELTDDYEMGLIVYDIKNDSIISFHGYGVDDVISNEAGARVIKTHDNFLLLGGFTFGFSTSTYKQDWYLVKTDSIGNMIWERHYGNPNENDGRIMAMLESQDSAYIVAGGQAICNWSSTPKPEACIRKVDTAGNLVWERFYRNYMYRESAEQMWFSETYCVDIIELEDRSFACLFSIQKQIGSKSFMLIKLNPSGKVLWTKRLETHNYEGTFVPSSLKQTSDNGFILNGHGNISLGQQFWLIKTDSLGNEGALYIAPPPENVECPDLPDTMYCSETYNSRLRVQGKSAPYTIEFSTGEVIEELYYPPVFIPESQGTGSFITYVGLTEYPQQYDTATLYGEIPSDDIIELPLSITIPENYFGPDLTATITNGYGEIYDITLPVYVDCNVSAELSSTSASVGVYPNPASDFLQISLPEFEQNSFVKIINTKGQTVLVEQMYNSETTFNISELPAGSYVVRVYCGNKISNIKVEIL